MELKHHGLTAVSRDEIKEELEHKGLERPCTFDIKFGDVICGHFTLAPMPGCCGAVISTATFLAKSSRNTAVSKLFREIKPLVAKRLGYSLMVATVQITNLPSLFSMRDAGYVFDTTFVNSRTRNTLVLGTKKL